MNSDLFIKNSITGKKEIFKPISTQRVGMYVCGPTVYSYFHLGNLRTFMSFDVVYRYLKHLGYKVRYVRNLTDLGHEEVESSDSQSISKVERQARVEQKEPMEIAHHYTQYFREICNVFGLLSPDIEPVATGHVIEQIEIIKKLLSDGYAYEVDGSVYFDVMRYDKDYSYGSVSNNNIQNLLDNTRTDLKNVEEKRSPLDFALWKRADDKHIMRWPSPWSVGFPGWHLECSAMSHKYLGTPFDIHGGGVDLKFPHHDCEVAQTTASQGKSKSVNYWMHANMLTIKGEKMSKSEGNYILPHEMIEGGDKIATTYGIEPPTSTDKDTELYRTIVMLRERRYSPYAIRFMMLQSHYTSTLSVTPKALEAADKGWKRLSSALDIVINLSYDNKSTLDIHSWVETCYEYMNDDFNTAKLIAHLFEGQKYIDKLKRGDDKITSADLTLLRDTFSQFFYDILGLQSHTAEEDQITKDDKSHALIHLLIKERQHARANKQWDVSDRIRDELLDHGIHLKDQADGTTYEIG